MIGLPRLSARTLFSSSARISAPIIFESSERSLFSAARQRRFISLFSVHHREQWPFTPHGFDRDSAQRDRRVRHSMSGCQASSSSSRRELRSSAKSASSAGTTGNQKSNDDNGSFESPPNLLVTRPVRHDRGTRQFLLDLDGNKVARIDYRHLGKDCIELYHTEVPEELRGKGIGKALAEGALECALGANLKLKVTCCYLQDYLTRFADDKYKKLAE
jgi:predicted GNAT family acetyltransferase